MYITSCASRVCARNACHKGLEKKPQYMYFFLGWYARVDGVKLCKSARFEISILQGSMLERAHGAASTRIRQADGPVRSVSSGTLLISGSIVFFKVVIVRSWQWWQIGY